MESAGTWWAIFDHGGGVGLAKRVLVSDASAESAKIIAEDGKAPPGLTPGAIVGIVLGVLVFILLLVLA